jgi:hypothetical protein
MVCSVLLFIVVLSAWPSYIYEAVELRIIENNNQYSQIRRTLLVRDVFKTHSSLKCFNLNIEQVKVNNLSRSFHT